MNILSEATELTPAERFILVAVRSWVGGLKAKQDDALFEAHIKTLKSVFSHIGGCAGLRNFELLMMLFAEHSIQMIDVRCTKCTKVSPDERRLIDIAAAFQYGYNRHGEALLSHYLPLECLTQAAHHARRLVAAMEADECELPRPTIPPSSHEQILRGKTIFYAGSTVH